MVLESLLQVTDHKVNFFKREITSLGTLGIFSGKITFLRTAEEIVRGCRRKKPSLYIFLRIKFK